VSRIDIRLSNVQLAQAHFQVFMPKNILEGVYVTAILEEIDREGMVELVQVDVFSPHLFGCTLKDISQVVPVDFPSFI
jgi:hypothetical protein